MPFPKPGPCHRPVRPGVFRRAGLSAVLSAQTGRREFPVWSAPAAGRASRAAALSSFRAPRRRCPGGNGPVRPSFASRTAVGLPFASGVSAPASFYRGLLSVHSLSGLRGCRAAQGGPSTPERFSLIVTSEGRSACCRPKRQLLGGIRARRENAPFHGALKFRSCEGKQRIAMVEGGEPNFRLTVFPHPLDATPICFKESMAFRQGIFTENNGA